MPKPKPQLHELIERREFINEKFIEYSALDRVAANYSALANLAFIGGRLDKLIRDQAARESQERRNSYKGSQHRPACKDTWKVTVPPADPSVIRRAIAWINGGSASGR